MASGNSWRAPAAAVAERLGQVGDVGAAEHGERGVEVVVARVDQLQRDDRAAEQLLRLGVRGVVGAEAGAGEQEPVGDAAGRPRPR